jgi:molybdopterin converting factor small subunit
MAVTVLLPTLLRAQTDGASSVTADGATVGEVFGDLIARFPGLSDNLLGADGALHRFVNVYRNDDDIRYLDRLDTPVADGDEISILPAVAGGAG